MFRYYFQIFICSAAAIAMGLAIVVFVSGVFTASLFRSEGFTKTFIERHETEIIAEIDKSMQSVSSVTGIPVDAYQAAYTGSSFSILSTERSRDFINGYSVDFSETVPLYNAFYSSISDYAGSNALSLNGDSISKNASYAVDAVNNVLTGNDPAEVAILKVGRSRTIVYGFIAAAFMVIAAGIVLEVLNDGRHRKYNYIGMGIVTGGYILVFVPLIIH